MQKVFKFREQPPEFLAWIKSSVVASPNIAYTLLKEPRVAVRRPLLSNFYSRGLPGESSRSSLAFPNLRTNYDW